MVCDWISLALVVMVWNTWHDYRGLPCPPPSLQVCGLNWMGAVYVTLHHLIAVGTAEFFASWFTLLVPPLLLWYTGTAIRRVKTVAEVSRHGI